MATCYELTAMIMGKMTEACNMRMLAKHLHRIIAELEEYQNSTTPNTLSHEAHGFLQASLDPAQRYGDLRDIIPVGLDRLRAVMNSLREQIDLVETRERLLRWLEFAQS